MDGRATRGRDNEMRLFIYGTLLDPGVFARCGGGMPGRQRSACLYGWRRVALRNSPYPTLRRDHHAVTHGAILDIPAGTARRIAAYEHPRYHLTRVVVCTTRGKTAAWTWIAKGATIREWKD